MQCVGGGKLDRTLIKQQFWLLEIISPVGNVGLRMTCIRVRLNQCTECSETKEVVTEQLDLLDHCVDFERECAGPAVRVGADDLRQRKTTLKQHHAQSAEESTHFGLCDFLHLLRDGKQVKSLLRKDALPKRLARKEHEVTQKPCLYMKDIQERKV